MAAFQYRSYSEQVGFIDRSKARSVSWPIFSNARAHSGCLPLAGVAQLVEQRFRKPQVVRSIRIAGSTPHFVRAAAFAHIAADRSFASSRLRFFTPCGVPRCPKIDK